MVRFKTHKLTDSLRNKNELPQHWKDSIVSFCKKGNKTLRLITLVNYIQNSIKYPSVNVCSINRESYLGSSATNQLLIIRSAFVKYWGEKWEQDMTVRQLLIYFEIPYYSSRKEILCNIWFNILM
jgi:hypothetical protein